MRYRGLLILAIGFAVLIILTALTGYLSTQRTAAAARKLAEIQQNEKTFTVRWNELQVGVYLEAVLARDFLIEPYSSDADALRLQFEAVGDDLEQKLDQLVASNAASGDALLPLRDSLTDYRDALTKILRTDPAYRSLDESKILLRQAAATRQTVIDVADGIRKLVETNTQATQATILANAANTEIFLQRLWSVTVLLSLLVAGAALLWISRLERRVDFHLAQIEGNREELRNLSNALVRAQEDERKRLSRELHDQVGQTITAIRMEIRAMQELRYASSPEFAERAAEALMLSEETLQTVRDMAMGLRPSMLDDLGLGAAVEWLTRDFSRRSGVASSARIDGQWDHIPESHRTCLFRIAQESLTNILRHAGAKNVQVMLHGGNASLILTVQDDGSGIDPETIHRGIGLLGMEERARELHGTLAIESKPSRGTRLQVELPLNVPNPGPQYSERPGSIPTP